MATTTEAPTKGDAEAGPGVPTLLVRGSIRVGEGQPPIAEAPIAYITAWLRRRMPDFGHHRATPADRVLIVKAETGSGKSTVLPVGIFRILRGAGTPAGQRFRGPGVLCTQPRVLTAMALASDVDRAHSPWNPDMVLGETVGFQTGPVSNSPVAGLIFATAGVLAAQLRRQEDAEVMARHRFIIVDEAHERSLDSDMMLLLLRNFYARNAGNEALPFLVLASATIAPARYAAYFGVGPANVVEVAGRAFRVEPVWPAQGTNDYPRAAAETAARIHAENAADPPAQADILVFVPGAAEAALVLQHLARLNPARSPMLVLKINREVVNSHAGDYALLFAPPEALPLVGGERPTRRVVVSTVVAETGLTIDTLKYVVDCGWSRAREVYQPWGVEGLTTRPAARSRIEQRKGRAGRRFPGEFHPLYTKNVFEALDEEQLPEIILGGPAPIYLALVREQQRQKLRTGLVPEFRVEDIAMLDPPPPEALLAVNAAATALGFVAADTPLPDRWPVDVRATATAARRGCGLTPLGHLAAAFTRVPMEGVRVLLAGPVWGAAASDLITAVAMFGTPAASLYATTRRPRGTGPLATGAAALRAALPPFLAARTGGAGVALPPTEEEAAYLRARVVLADDFAEVVLIFDAFARRLDQAQGDVVAAADWCEGIELSYEGLVELARRRDDIIEEMVVAGLDPLRAAGRRLAISPMSDFTERLRVFKRCLYDGLRGRLLCFEGRGPDAGYVTPQGMRVRSPELLTDAAADRLRVATLRPRWVLTDTFRLRPADRRPEDEAPPLLYAVEANLISVLDGFVDPDLDFIGPILEGRP